MQELIKQDLNKALKEKKELEISVLRGILAVSQNKEKEKQYQSKNQEAVLTDEEFLKLIFSEVKKREESILEFEKGKRQDLIDKEEKELQILKKYLPELLSEQELKEIIQKAIEKTGATQIKDMKKVIAEVIPQVGQKARGDQIAKIAKELLCQ